MKARVAWCAESDDNRYKAGVRFEVITDDAAHLAAPRCCATAIAAWPDLNADR